MNVRFSTEAQEQAEAIDTWWRDNRPEAADLFARELAEAKAVLVVSTRSAPVFTILHEQPVRRIWLPRTRHHVYYTCDFANGMVMVHAVWGGPREKPPKL